jgi:hypothetical protein
MKPLAPLAIPGYITEAEQAVRLGQNLQTRRRNRRAGIGPTAVKVGRRFVYRDGADAEWLAAEEAEAARARAKTWRRRARHAGAEASR